MVDNQSQMLDSIMNRFNTSEPQRDVDEQEAVDRLAQLIETPKKTKRMKYYVVMFYESQ